SDKRNLEKETQDKQDTNEYRPDLPGCGAPKSIDKLFTHGAKRSFGNKVSRQPALADFRRWRRVFRRRLNFLLLRQLPAPALPAPAPSAPDPFPTRSPGLQKSLPPGYISNSLPASGSVTFLSIGLK